MGPHGEPIEAVGAAHRRRANIMRLRLRLKLREVECNDEDEWMGFIVNEREENFVEKVSMCPPIIECRCHIACNSYSLSLLPPLLLLSHAHILSL